MRYVQVTTLGLLVILAGCGGHDNRASGPGTGNEPAPTGTGSVTIAVEWPERTGEVQPQLLPEASNSLKAEIVDDGDELLSETLVITRPETEGTLEDVPAGQHTLRVAAYPTADATGVAQASAEKSITVQAGQTAPAERITLLTTIDHIDITPETPAVEGGDSIALTATAKDATGQTVLVRQNQPFSWAIESGASYATVGRYTGLVQGVAEGTATVNATEEETGKSGTVAVTVKVGEIAFSSDRDGNCEIYSMKPDGSGQTNLTQNPATDLCACWSPDGAKLAFQSDRDGNHEIYAMNADGSGQTRLTHNTANDGNPDWSPSGTKIAFGSDRDLGNEVFEVYVMNTDGSGQTRLTYNTASELDPEWSHDGTKIAFVSDRDGNREIYTMNADGSGQTRLTYNSASDQCPEWSRDSSKILFASNRDGNCEIYVMNPDGSNQTRLTNHAATDWDPAWSLGGARIAFRSDRDGNVEVYVMNADGSQPTRITHNSAMDWDVEWGGGLLGWPTFLPGCPQW